MSYNISTAYKPGTLENSDYWTLDIDYESENSVVESHGAIMQIHGTSLSACMIKARFICDMLNEDVFKGIEASINLMELAKSLP